MEDPLADLLKRAKQFDIDALASIYDQHSQGIYRYAMRMLGDEMLAEDCTGETFHRFLGALRDRRGPDHNLQAYLYRTAHNWITDHYRKRKCQETPLDEDLKDRQPEIAFLAQDQIDQQRVRSFIIELTPDQRQVILLKYYEGWENNEIASALNKPVGAVKSLLHRAIIRLKKISGRQ